MEGVRAVFGWYLGICEGERTFSHPARSTRKSFDTNASVCEQNTPSFTLIARTSTKVKIDSPVSTHKPTMKCEREESALSPVRPLLTKHGVIQIAHTKIKRKLTTARRPDAARSERSACVPSSSVSTGSSVAPLGHTPRVGHAPVRVKQNTTSVHYFPIRK